MIDLSEWPSALKIASLFTPFLIMLVGLAIELHIAASRHFEVMCAALQRSRGLHDELKNGGALTLKLRLMTVSAMTAGMMWPNLSIRQGWLDPEDSRLFPAYLKRRMKTGMYCMYIGMGWIAFVVFLVEFKRT
ncbi:hypothetical protein NJF44_25465 [Pseudomonas guariconensis]|uniref:hypothetical protein n=1 Tax=Pseudomonas TaxID=286 RepID=UPI001CE47970|nr:MULTISPECIES: hypothetical protein [Pseudomonas]MCO7642989.1 hypothetical protein [Pseudomonas sp. S 311-6]MCO7518084.1 hypothetical protein [Pseudomonas putida]MCO7567678.1 hypothetical protein [Pseudomonas mosselii]MCO7596279.1 hypothetical protein [Pseudomonas guariconensis]MCO7608581.1 hypothetical protein [Pseudomonas guariconensis]